VPTSTSFSALDAAGRAAALVDGGSLATLGGTTDSGTLWIGRGSIGGRPVLLALTDGHKKGGTIGREEARAFTQLTAAAAERSAAVIVGWDTGGVRVQEGPGALAAAAAAGVALTRLALTGVPVATVISGPRGCFGAPAVIAAVSHVTLITANAHWGLTGPKLLDRNGAPVDEQAGRRTTAAAHRQHAGHATALVADSPAAIRAEIGAFLGQRLRRSRPLQVVNGFVNRTEALLAQLRSARAGDGTSAPQDLATLGRQRDFLRYSCRGHWRPTGPAVRRGHVQAAWGELNDRPAMAIIVGGERSRGGIGIEDAATVTEMVRFAIRESGRERAPILTFLFCRGHANELAEEHAGLHCALAECFKSFVTARLLGHPLLSILGGGAYGAAYLALAAPSHRILAIRGTTVAPMAPRVLDAFRRLRGLRHDPQTPQDLAELIPEIRIVENVVRLPRVLHEEWDAARRSVRPLVKLTGSLTTTPVRLMWARPGGVGKTSR
jgi:malonate decarboxylase beta subunit